MLTFIKNNISWVAPSVAILAVGSGFMDRIDPRRQADDVQAPVVQAAQTAPVAETPAENLSTSQLLNALVSETIAPEEPAVTRTAGLETAALTSIVAQAQAPVETPVAAQPEVVAPPANTGITDDPAAFFAAAQANLENTDACFADLQDLASQARIYFTSGTLSGDQKGLVQARLIGQIAATCPGVTINVEGHSDPSGDRNINMQLSLQRAQSVVNRLAASGIDTANFVPVGMGDRTPSGVTGPQPAAFYDRRVEFSIVRDNAAIPASLTVPGATRWNVPACVSDLERLTQQTRLFYGPGSVVVPGADMGKVYQIATQAEACPEAKLRVIGNFSNQPDAHEDAATGRMRAVAVMSTLVSAGFAPEGILISAPSWSVAKAGQPARAASHVAFDVVVTQ